MIVTIKSILQHNVAVDSDITVRGWLRSRRSSKGGFSFLHIHDGSCFGTVQAVADNTGPITRRSSNPARASSVSVTGRLVESQGKGQDREIQAHHVAIHGMVDDPETYPISKKQHSFEYLRSVAHPPPADQHVGALSRIRHALSAEVHGFFDREGFYWVNTPIITASDCEGVGDLFRVSTLDHIHQGQTNQFDQDFSAAKPSSRSAVSSTSKVTPVPWVRFTPLGQPFGQKTPTPADIWRSFG